MSLSGSNELGGEAGKRETQHQSDAGGKPGWKPCSPSHLSLCLAQPDSSGPLASRSPAPTLICCSVSAFFPSRYTVQMKSPACCVRRQGSARGLDSRCSWLP